MTERARIRIAAGATALFLVVMSAAGLATHSHAPAAPPARTAAVAPPLTQALAASGERGDEADATGLEERGDD